jgi:hypothetical protein
MPVTAEVQEKEACSPGAAAARGAAMRLLLLAALPFLTTFAPFSLARDPVTPAVLRLSAEPVALRPDAPERRRLGGLTFLEGWVLRGNDPRFGGISAMHIEGEEVSALTDGARLYFLRLPERAGTTRMTSKWLEGAPGTKKELRDSEAMAVHGEQAWISYERLNAVRRYARPGWKATAEARPALMRSWPLNAGAEAMLRLPDGRFLIFCEGRRNEAGVTPAVLFHGDPALPNVRAEHIGYRAPEGFRITDAAALPDGRLIFLNRRISWLDGIQVKVTIAAAPELRAGAVIKGRELAHFGPEVTTDNYEALSITREGGRTILWIASDDNYMSFQRTLLMKFALDE